MRADPEVVFVRHLLQATHRAGVLYGNFLFALPDGLGEVSLPLEHFVGVGEVEHQASVRTARLLWQLNGDGLARLAVKESGCISAVAELEVDVEGRARLLCMAISLSIVAGAAGTRASRSRTSLMIDQ